MSIPGQQNTLSKGPASGLQHRPCPRTTEPPPGGSPPNSWYQVSNRLLTQEVLPHGQSGKRIPNLSPLPSPASSPPQELSLEDPAHHSEHNRVPTTALPAPLIVQTTLGLSLPWVPGLISLQLTLAM